MSSGNNRKPRHNDMGAGMSAALAVSDERLATTAVGILNAAFRIGWDRKHGGIFYFIDTEGRPPMQLEAPMKLWWPRTEALYAFALAYDMTGDRKPAARHKLVHDYSWKHFRDRKYGEWYGYLDREGRPTHLLKGGRFEGFFHLPRALLNCILLQS